MIKEGKCNLSSGLDFGNQMKKANRTMILPTKHCSTIDELY
jgi:hypothetical protein